MNVIQKGKRSKVLPRKGLRTASSSSRLLLDHSARMEEQPSGVKLQERHDI